MEGPQPAWREGHGRLPRSRTEENRQELIPCRSELPSHGNAASASPVAHPAAGAREAGSDAGRFSKGRTASAMRMRLCHPQHRLPAARCRAQPLPAPSMETWDHPKYFSLDPPSMSGSPAVEQDEHPQERQRNNYY